jgi:hypothetical protein
VRRAVQQRRRPAGALPTPPWPSHLEICEGTCSQYPTSSRVSRSVTGRPPRWTLPLTRAARLHPPSVSAGRVAGQVSWRGQFWGGRMIARGRGGSRPRRGAALRCAHPPKPDARASIVPKRAAGRPLLYHGGCMPIPRPTKQRALARTRGPHKRRQPARGRDARHAAKQRGALRLPRCRRRRAARRRARAFSAGAGRLGYTVAHERLDAAGGTPGGRRRESVVKVLTSHGKGGLSGGWE